MYTIGEIAKKTGLPISTLRYYDKQGLFPELQRVSGARRFGEKELAALRIIECLKRSGLGIAEIRQYMEWCVEGPSTYAMRKELFEKQKKAVEAELVHMNEVLELLNYKCSLYEKLMSEEASHEFS